VFANGQFLFASEQVKTNPALARSVYIKDATILACFYSLCIIVNDLITPKPMIKWITHPTVLSGENITLEPMEQHHLPELELLARDKRIWEFYAQDCSDPKTFAEAFAMALTERDMLGIQYPFVIRENGTGKLIGSTRYLDIQPKHRKLEIGWTWLHPGYWATAINPECKLILLTHCFEVLNASRVCIKTNEHNKRSRKAIEKIGGKFEGIIRHEIIQDNGVRRNSAWYSIIDSEWAEVKPMLAGLHELKKHTSKA
jgi:RimJ/RimL family protein N-acetyltransferase